VVGGVFNVFWYQRKDFVESGPDMEISGRDLGFGRGGDGRGLEIWVKKGAKV